MAQYHSDRRLAIEQEEEIERAKWELREFEKALDKLYEWEEQSVRDVALRKWERESERIMANQAALLEDMERVARRDVERKKKPFARIWTNSCRCSMTKSVSTWIASGKRNFG